MNITCIGNPEILTIKYFFIVKNTFCTLPFCKSTEYVCISRYLIKGILTDFVKRPEGNLKNFKFHFLDYQDDLYHHPEEYFLTGIYPT